MNYYEYIVLDAMDIFYVFYDILLLIKKISGFVFDFDKVTFLRTNTPTTKRRPDGLVMIIVVGNSTRIVDNI